MTVLPELGEASRRSPAHAYPDLCKDRACPGKGIRHSRHGPHHRAAASPRTRPACCPKGASALIRKGTWDIPAIFDLVRNKAGVDDEEMYRDFNMGIGMVLAVPAKQAEAVMKKAKKAGREGVAHRRDREGKAGRYIQLG